MFGRAEESRDAGRVRHRLRQARDPSVCSPPATSTLRPQSEPCTLSGNFQPLPRTLTCKKISFNGNHKMLPGVWLYSITVRCIRLRLSLSRSSHFCRGVFRKTAQGKDSDLFTL